MPASNFVRTEFEVEIASTGQRIVIPPHRNVLDVLAEHGVAIAWSCGMGTCGTCRTGLLAGTPDHWDSILRPAARERGDVFMPCCSRSKTPLLVLDL